MHKLNTQSMSDSIYRYQSVSLSPSSQAVPSSSSHSLLTFPSPSLPFDNISSLVPSIPLDVQHFLKPFPVTSSEICCYSVMIHTDWLIHLYFLVYKLSWTHEEDLQFSPHIISGVKNFKYMCSGLLCCVCGLISVSSWLFYCFLLLSGPGFIFEPVVNVSIAIFLLLPLDWICSQVHILTSYCFYGAQELRIAQSKEYSRLGASLPENGNRAGCRDITLP